MSDFEKIEGGHIDSSPDRIGLIILDSCTYRSKRWVKDYEPCFVDDTYCSSNWRYNLARNSRRLKLCGGVMALMIIESLMALVASILCCRGSCGGCRSGDCCSAECCDSSLQGKILFYVILLSDRMIERFDTK